MNAFGTSRTCTSQLDHPSITPQYFNQKNHRLTEIPFGVVLRPRKRPRRGSRSQGHSHKNISSLPRRPSDPPSRPGPGEDRGADTMNVDAEGLVPKGTKKSTTNVNKVAGSCMPLSNSTTYVGTGYKEEVQRLSSFASGTYRCSVVISIAPPYSKSHRKITRSFTPHFIAISPVPGFCLARTLTLILRVPPTKVRNITVGSSLTKRNAGKSGQAFVG